MGNPGLDAMLDGGLVARRPYLIVGPAGTGKTTLALQFLCAGIRNGERALLVTLEEPPNEVRANHRALSAELGKVDVFDAIPDVMRYERAPFKDIAAVRSATPFERVSESIRRTPELTSIEVTITALEQMLRSEVQRHAYSRIVIDSLTALQYFCMKGFDIVAGAQTFLRYLSDLRVTTILTVEAPLEDVETPERMLARGEIRLFRWELDDLTVRAVGVEKFRGSAHDIRLHPYRIGPTGLDINLAVTISRDTREILEGTPAQVPGAVPTETVEPIPSTLDLLNEELRDLTLVGADLGPIRAELEGALASARSGDSEHATERLLRAVALGATLPQRLPTATTHPDGEIARALHRLVARAESSRGGQPPVRVPEPPILTARLAKTLLDLRPPVEPERPTSAPAPVTVSAQPAEPATAVAAPAVVEMAPPIAAPPAATPPATPPTPLPPSVETSRPPAPAARMLPPPTRTVRASPPPLPEAIRMPEASRASAKTPGPPTPSRPRPSTSGSRAPRSRTLAPPNVSTAPGVAPTPSTALELSAGIGAVEAAEGSAPKKKKRVPSSPRKKAAPTPPQEPAVIPVPEPTPPVPAGLPVSPPEPSTTITAGVTPVVEAPTGDAAALAPAATAAPRPKRRVVRKKKAPPVVGATAGPPAEDTATTPSPPPPDPSPPVEAPQPLPPAGTP